MRYRCLGILFCLAALLAGLGAADSASDLTGTWKFSVDLDTGEHGDPVFVIKQVNDQLTGSYQGPFGKQKVTGSVKGDTAMLEVAASGPDGSVKLSYTGKLEGSDKMSGMMTRNISGVSTPGKWTAIRSK